MNSDLPLLPIGSSLKRPYDVIHCKPQLLATDLDFEFPPLYEIPRPVGDGGDPGGDLPFARRGGCAAYVLLLAGPPSMNRT